MYRELEIKKGWGQEKGARTHVSPCEREEGCVYMQALGFYYSG